MVSTVTQLKGYSQGTIVESDERLLFISGHIPLDKNDLTGKPVEGDLEVQLEQVFRNLDETLRAAGASWENMLKMTYYIVGLEMKHMATIRVVRDRYINPDCPPALAFIGVPCLALPQFLCEVDGVATLPKK
ncbi:TPA: RidA family protein [Burkholderia cepacia]|uniref:RidA family protein n=1 Tax=Burkholderia cepacia TaxID=292 RepID=UPI000D2F2243|nr:RidA family protein [Burkholderia cepacia]MCA8357610.1 RidA family protein [Burkholderia cepacia]HDV6368278.1 RidA family protein [Burkholderia cepacia]